MIQPVLTLVATRPGPLLPRDSRKLLWRLYLNWLAAATMDETEQLERVLARHAHHVRPLVDAVSANAWKPELTQVPLRALA